MVRLLVPEGEAQHVLARRWPDPLPPQPSLIVSPWRSTLYATGSITLLALVGKSRPGTFLKAAAYISVADVSLSALDIYSRRELNRGVFKLENIEPKPGKMWEQTKHWTCDDFMLNGGVLGAVLSLNPRALPGVGGWRRLVGAATVGAGLGSYFANKSIVRFPPEALKDLYKRDAQTRGNMYQRLKGDTRARESLSTFGRLALAWYTWPIWDMEMNPFKRAQSSQASPMMIARHHKNNHRSDEVYGFPIMLWKSELDGPDIAAGGRTYMDCLETRDTDALQDTIGRLQKLARVNATATKYIMHLRATLEDEFYKLTRESEEKDVMRRQLQLLHALEVEYISRDAIIGLYAADAQKRLKQAFKVFDGQSDGVTAFSPPGELPAGWLDASSSDMVATRVRMHWQNQKEQLGQLEQIDSFHSRAEPGSDADMGQHYSQIRMSVEQMKRNVEATAQLLKLVEDDIYRAERRADEARKRDAA